VNGKIRQWILLAAADGGVTTAALRREFELELRTAASHLRKLRDSGLLEQDGELGASGAMRSFITDAGRDYLAANGVGIDGRAAGAPRFDDSALRAALGM
jgi:hypothetical protein